jgi:hypothetical protein
MPPKATDCCAATRCRDGPVATKVHCSKQKGRLAATLQVRIIVVRSGDSLPNESRQAARTEVTNASSSVCSRLLSRDNDCAAARTCPEAEPVARGWFPRQSEGRQLRSDWIAPLRSGQIRVNII